MQNAQTTEQALILIDEVFLLPPSMKEEFKEIFPLMDEKERNEFLVYLHSILEKQDEILETLIKNNPDFISELKGHKAHGDRKKMKRNEEKSIAGEKMDVTALEEALKKI